MVRNTDNIEISDEPPSAYVPKIQIRFNAEEWQRMHELHALPEHRESLAYPEVPAVRRRLMAGIIRRWFESV